MRASKQIYLECLEYMSKLSGISVKELSSDSIDLDSLQNVADNAFNKNKFKAHVQLDITVKTVIVSCYKKLRQYVLDAASPYKFGDTLDTTIFNSIDTGIVIDTEINNKHISLFVWRWTDAPVFNGNKNYYVVDVFTNGMTSSRISFCMNETENLRKVYLCPNDHCTLCDSCNIVNDMYLLSRRKFDTCPNYTVYDVDLFTMVKAIITVLNTEIKVRDSITRVDNRSNEDSKIEKSTYVAKENTDVDVAIPMCSYSYTYNPSTKKISKGGHHKSPAAHIRRGYFRRSRIGDHIMKDGEFVRVEKGKGDYTWVESHPVNTKSNSIGYYEVKGDI